MLEKEIEKHLRKKVKAEGGECFKLVGTFKAGIPDRLVILPGGIVVFVELKAPGKKARRLQEIMHHRLKKLGALVAVLDSKTAVNKFIDDAKKK